MYVHCLAYIVCVCVCLCLFIDRFQIWNWDRLKEFLAYPRNDYAIQNNEWLTKHNKENKKVMCVPK